LVLNQLRIVAKFKSIRDLAGHQNPRAFAALQGEEAADLWYPASQIREIANQILSLLPATPEEDADVQDR
jgi:hypothetical protein